MSASLRFPEVWIRFLIAIGGLALAFAAALFSTVTRESGNVWGTLIWDRSRVLATLVGVTTVPAWRVGLPPRGCEMRWTTGDPSGEDLCRHGNCDRGRDTQYRKQSALHYCGGHASGHHRLWNCLRDGAAPILQLDVRLPEHVFAGRDTFGKIVVRDPRGRLQMVFPSAWCLCRKRERREEALAAPSYRFRVPPRGGPAKEQWLRTPDWRVRRVQGKDVHGPHF